MSLRTLVFSCLIFALTVGPSLADTLRIKKTQFAPGETIRLEFEAASYPDNAWVGIIPSNIEHGEESVNDQHDLAYQYLKGKTQGTLEFKAPQKPGGYDFRLNNSDSSGQETTHVSFTVGLTEIGPASLTLDAKRFAPGASLVVQYKAPAGLQSNAWMGLIPADVPHGDESVNDQHDIAYQYLKGATSGEMRFTAPANAGDWTVRLHDTDSSGRELTSVSFSVGGDLDMKGMAVQLAATGRTPVYGIRFSSGQAHLTSQADGALAEVAKLLRKDPSLRLRIEGHTDNQGSASGNLSLSKRRAEAVLENLIQVQGISATRLEAVGRGAGEPVSKNETSAGRAQNRRVDLVKIAG